MIGMPIVWSPVGEPMWESQRVRESTSIAYINLVAHRSACVRPSFTVITSGPA